MAKKQRAKPSDRKIVAEIEKLHDSLHLVFCTAISIQLNLKSGLEDANEEIGRLMEHNVVEELWRIGEQFDFILMDLGGKARFAPISAAEEFTSD